MKVGTLIPPSTVGKALLTEGGGGLAGEIRKFIDAGADHIELSGEVFMILPAPLLERLAKEFERGVRDLTDEGISFSVHLPFMGGMDVTTTDEGIRTAGVELVRRIAETCAPLDPISYVLHVAGFLEDMMGIGLAGQAGEMVTGSLLDAASRSIADISKFIEPSKISIENLEYCDFSMLHPLVDKHKTGICMDVGHVHIRRESIPEFIDKYFGQLNQLHVHDVKMTKPARHITSLYDHHELGSGILDLESLVGDLKDRGFSGPLVIEVFRVNPTESISILRNAVGPKA